MLSSVLNSEKAIKVNIQIMRIFTKVRETLIDNLSMKLDIEEIKKKLANQDKNIELVFQYLDELIEITRHIRGIKNFINSMRRTVTFCLPAAFIFAPDEMSGFTLGSNLKQRRNTRKAFPSSRLLLLFPLRFHKT
jgi:sarcosine oxidase delta subunit